MLVNTGSSTFFILNRAEKKQYSKRSSIFSENVQRKSLNNCNKSTHLVTIKLQNFPPLGKCIFCHLPLNKLGSLLVVQLGLQSNFPQALALFVSCYLITWPLSCPIQPAVLGDKKDSANTVVLFPS